MANLEASKALDIHHEIEVLQDSSGSPLIFSIGNDNVFYLVKRVSDSQTGWQQIDLSTKIGNDIEAAVFEARQDLNGNIWIALAVQKKGDPNKMTLYMTPPLFNDPVMDWSSIKWVKRPFSEDKLKITQIILGTNDDNKGAPTTIVALERVKNISTHYRVNTNLEDSSWVWEEYPLPENAERILDLAIGTIKGRRGVYALYRTSTGLSLEFTTLPDPTLRTSRSYTFNLPKDKDITAITALSSYVNSFNLYAAGDGIYLFKHSSIDATIIADTLSDIHSLVVKQDDENVAIWAVQGDKKLQYIHGKKGKQLEWSYPVPIQSEVVQLSAVRNRCRLANELFVVKGNQTLSYLWQDPTSLNWQESPIPLYDTGKILSFNCYMTCINLCNEKNLPVFDQSVNITASEWTYVTINGVSHSLDDKTPVSVTPDIQGNITIINKINSIATPTFRLQADFLEKPVEIDPTHKVMDEMKKIKSGEDLANARLQNGEYLLDEQKRGDRTTLDNAAKSIQGLISVSDTLSQGSLLKNRSDDSLKLGSSVAVSSIWGTSFSLDGVDPIIVEAGNFLKTLENRLEEVVNFIWKTTGEGIEFICKIAGDIFKFFIQNAVEVFNLINWWLKKNLGIDLEKIIQWLGFIFDWKDIIRTKKVLKTLFNHGINKAIREIEAIKPLVKNSFNTLREEIKKIKKESLPKEFNENWYSRKGEDPMQQPSCKWMEYNLLHGGLIENAKMADKKGEQAFDMEVGEKEMAIIMQAVEGIKSDIEHIGSLSITEIIMLIVSRIAETLIEVTEVLVMGLLQEAIRVIKILQNLLDQKIDIPILTAVYKKFVGADLSLIDLICLIIAIPTTVLYKVIFDKAPFTEEMTDFIIESKDLEQVILYLN